MIVSKIADDLSIALDAMASLHLITHGSSIPFIRQGWIEVVGHVTRGTRSRLLLDCLRQMLESAIDVCQCAHSRLNHG